jgi:hypothetical protein
MDDGPWCVHADPRRHAAICLAGLRPQVRGRHPGGHSYRALRLGNPPSCAQPHAAGCLYADPRHRAAICLAGLRPLVRGRHPGGQCPRPTARSGLFVRRSAASCRDLLGGPPPAGSRPPSRRPVPAPNRTQRAVCTQIRGIVPRSAWRASARWFEAAIPAASARAQPHAAGCLYADPRRHAAICLAGLRPLVRGRHPGGHSYRAL